MKRLNIIAGLFDQMGLLETVREHRLNIFSTQTLNWDSWVSVRKMPNAGKTSRFFEVKISTRSF